MTWIVETLNTVVDAELAALPKDMRAKFVRISFLIEELGLEKVREPHVKYLGENLWEMRMMGRGRYFAGALCDEVRSAGRGGARLHQENPKNAEARDRACLTTCRGDRAMTDIRDLHETWMEDPEYQAEYEALDEEFTLAHALITARTQAGLTQAEVAKRMQTTQSVIARMESGRVRPTTQTLERFAKATGTRLRISFEVGEVGA